MRISDWSSDVCSSDLAVYRGTLEPPMHGAFGPTLGMIGDKQKSITGSCRRLAQRPRPRQQHARLPVLPLPLQRQLRPRRAWAWISDARSRSEEHTSELQSLMRISYAVFCLHKKNKTQKTWQRSLQT